MILEFQRLLLVHEVHALRQLQVVHQNLEDLVDLEFPLDLSVRVVRAVQVILVHRSLHFLPKVLVLPKVDGIYIAGIFRKLTVISHLFLMST